VVRVVAERRVVLAAPVLQAHSSHSGC
jgi:hypothetical protein